MGSRIRVSFEDEKGAETGMPSFDSDDAWYINISSLNYAY